jgi:biotin transporter BioY
MELSRLHTPARVLLFGAGYFLIGRLFPQPANHLQAWRLAAWVCSGGLYAGHVWYEHFQLRNSLSMPFHVAAAVGVGAFGLALAAMLHSLSISGTIRPVWLIALIIWPAVTAVPALIGALMARALLRRFGRRPVNYREAI